MAAQGEREPGGLDKCSNVLDPMAQDIPEQDFVMGEQELPPQTNPEPEMAAACDASPPPLHRNPSPIPAETAQLSAPNIAQLVAILAGMENRIEANRREIKNNMEGMSKGMEANTSRMEQTMRGEMRQVGQCLQADKMATPRATTSELEGSAPAGEDI